MLIQKTEFFNKFHSLKYFSKTWFHMKLELVFIPSPDDGHLRPLVEVAKLLVNRVDQLVVTVLIIPSMHGFDSQNCSSNIRTYVSYDFTKQCICDIYITYFRCWISKFLNSDGSYLATILIIHSCQTLPTCIIELLKCTYIFDHISC